MNWSRQDESLPGSEKEGGHINCEDSDLEHNDLVKGCNHYTTTYRNVMSCHDVILWSTWGKTANPTSFRFRNVHCAFQCAEVEMDKIFGQNNIQVKVFL